MYILVEYRGQLYPRLIAQRPLENTKNTIRTLEPLHAGHHHCLPPTAVFQNGCLQSQISRSPIALKLLEELQWTLVEVGEVKPTL